MAETSPRFVLLRGLGREREHWGEFPELLASRYPGCSIQFIDLPGAGQRNAEKAPTSVPATVDACRTLLDGPGAYLVAISFGAMVGAEWLHKYPKDFRGAVLMNTSFRGLDPWYRRFSPSALLTLVEGLATRDPRRQEELILKLTSQKPIETHVLDQREAIARARPVSRKTIVSQMAAGAKYEPHPARPQAPVLVLSSKGDRLANPACSRRIAALWSSPQAEHPWAGHDLPFDDPSWVVSQISEWIERR